MSSTSRRTCITSTSQNAEWQQTPEEFIDSGNFCRDTPRIVIGNDMGQTVPERSEWGSLISAPLASLGYCVAFHTGFSRHGGGQRGEGVFFTCGFRNDRIRKSESFVLTK